MTPGTARRAGTSDAGPANRAQSYRPDIDGLRAVAIIPVVLFHADIGPFAGGFVGVDIFFVISGFLISRIIFSGLETRQFSIRSFYARRVRRIFPAPLLVLSIVLLAGWFLLLDFEYKSLGEHVAGGAAFVANFVAMADPATLPVTSIRSPSFISGHWVSRNSST